MPVVSNGLYSNPDMGSIVSNLGTAIWGSPEARMKRDYYDAESQAARSRTNKTDEETRGLSLKNGAYADLPNIATAFAPLPGETADQHAARIIPFIGRIVQAGGGNAQELMNGINAGIRGAFAQGNEDDVRRSMAMDGKTPGKDFALTAQRADDIANRDADALYRKDTKVADIKAGADLGVQRLRNEGEIAKVHAGPVVAKRGEDVYLAPDDPRRAFIGTDGVVHGAPTLDGVRADAGQKIADLPDGQAPSSNLANVFSGGAGYKGATGGKPAAVNGKNLDDAVLAGARMVPGATVQAGSKYALAPEFEASFAPEKVTAARNAAADAYAKTRDVQKAGQAYLNTLGVTQGQTFGKPSGIIGSIFGDKGMQPAPAAAPAAPAAPAAAAPIQIPPAPQREIGKTYPTPKGDLEWTGTGWRVPTAKGPVY